MVMTAFRMAWPQWHFAKLHDPEKHKRMVARSATYFLLVCVMMLVAQGIWMPLMVRVLLRNDGFWSAGPTALILTGATVLYSAYFVFWIGCNVAKKNRLVPVRRHGRFRPQHRPQPPAHPALRHDRRRLDHGGRLRRAGGCSSIRSRGTTIRSLTSGRGSSR